jgi:hypothetical protein
LISKVSREYFELAVKEYDLPVEIAVKYINDSRLLPHLIKHYKAFDQFIQAVLHYARESK